MSDYIKEPSKKYDLITNLEQIQHLKWQGEFGKNEKKIGRWIAIWKGQTLEAVNRWYSEDGLQSGLQTELINNYWSKADIYVYGEYYNHQKQGVWKFIIQDNMIVGGLYKQGQKVGKWIDLNDSVQNQNQIVYNGEYKNGNKIGLWNILYKSKDSNYKIIGGGQYDENGQKNGRWIDLNNVFWNKSEVIYHGQYKNGIKIGKWDTYSRVDQNQPFKKTGGGLYDEQEGQKYGQWIELSNSFYSECQIYYKGEYKKDKKISKWNILYKFINTPLQQIGGGSYDQEGLQNGRWKELSTNFWNKSEIIYSGEYKSGVKIGRWDIVYGILQIGGGSYLQGQKDGKWVEISDNFYEYRVQYQILLVIVKQLIKANMFPQRKREYGISFIMINRCKIQTIIIFVNRGGGSYDYQEGLKNGIWIELSNNFYNSSKVIYKGEYKSGIKIGIWDISFKQHSYQNWEIIGGGEYDDLGLKIGEWVDINDDFWDESQVTYTGIYQNSKKVGTWSIRFRDSYRKIWNLIGGGEYDENGLKTNKWRVLGDNFGEQQYRFYRKLIK
ncbi:unnamed protein product [Paramecium primaurelia]|uniref:Uncharacterized protein n=1 Tax=Paramecium primaurelia TaxID=5886 RepID=A0A8S1QSE5_PARPR|nr:unnamed protein product [Paramecium primaurelia]